MTEERLPQVPPTIAALTDAIAATLGVAVAGPLGAVAGVAVGRAVHSLAYDMMSARQTSGFKPCSK